jgi:crossover junction endodeoxyribonuclease RuvC
VEGDSVLGGRGEGEVIHFLGIDPGASGGAALIDEDYKVISVMKFAATERDISDWFLEQVPHPDVVAAIERVGAMPKQGVASSFKFGQSYGFLRAMLIAFGIRFEAVTPGKWQRELGCLSRGQKNVTKAKAQETFPGVKCTHAISDALLLAMYARRRISYGPRLHAKEVEKR